MNRTLVSTILFFLFFSCVSVKRTPVIYYEDVELGKNLALAKTKSYHWFFNHRAENVEPNSKWVIANNSSSPDFVYYGRLNAEDKNNLKLHEFYKVSRKDLDKYFPKFISMDGSVLNGILFAEHIEPLIKKEFASTCPNRYTIEYKDKWYKLKKEGIQAFVLMDAFCYNNPPKKHKLNLLLDKNNLKKIPRKN